MTKPKASQEETVPKRTSVETQLRARIAELLSTRLMCAWCSQQFSHDAKSELFAHVQHCPKNRHRQIIHALAVQDHIDGKRKCCRICLRSWERMGFEDHAEDCDANAYPELAMAFSLDGNKWSPA